MTTSHLKTVCITSCKNNTLRSHDHPLWVVGPLIGCYFDQSPPHHHQLRIYYELNLDIPTILSWWLIYMWLVLVNPYVLILFLLWSPCKSKIMIRWLSYKVIIANIIYDMIVNSKSKLKLWWYPFISCNFLFKTNNFLSNIIKHKRPSGDFCKGYIGFTSKQYGYVLPCLQGKT